MPILRFTITGSYEAHPENYVDLGDDPITAAQMAAIDQENIDSGSVDVRDVIEWGADREYTIAIEAQ